MSKFDDHESWAGGSFDALMFFGLVAVERAMEITKAIWTCNSLVGPFNRHDREPESLPRVNEFNFSDEGCEQLYGVITFPGDESSCIVQTTLFDSDGLWVYLGPTAGSLPKSWNVGSYPFDDGLNQRGQSN